MKFENVGHAMRVRDAMITRLDINRTTMRDARNMKDSPEQRRIIAAAEAAHENDCDTFCEAHSFVVANRH